MDRRRAAPFSLWKAMILAMWIAFAIAAIIRSLSESRASYDTPSWARPQNMVNPSSAPVRFTA